MAITLVQHIESYSTSAATISATLGATPGRGNVLLITISSSTNTTIPTTPVGWTRILTRNTSPGQVNIYKRRPATVAEPTTYSFAVSASQNYTMIIQEWSGCDPFSPHIQGNSSLQAGSATWAALNLTPAYLNMQVLEFVCPTTTVVPNTPSGYTALTATASTNAGQIYPFQRNALTSDTTTAIGTAVTFPSSVGGEYAVIFLAPEPQKPYIIQSNNVAATTQTTIGTTLVEPTDSTSTIVGAFATSNTSATQAPKAGWTLLDDTTGGTGRLLTFWANNLTVAGNTSIQFTVMSASSSGVVDIEEYTGADTSTPINGHTVNSATLTASSAGSVNTTTFTPNVVGTLAILRASTDDTTRTISTPTGFALVGSRVSTEDYADFMSTTWTTDTTTAQVYTINVPSAAGSGTLIGSAIFLAPVAVAGGANWVQSAYDQMKLLNLL